MSNGWMNKIFSTTTIDQNLDLRSKYFRRESKNAKSKKKWPSFFEKAESDRKMVENGRFLKSKVADIW